MMPVATASMEQMRAWHSQPMPPPFRDVEDDIGIGVAHSRRSSFSYHRLPEPLIRLSVRKLDGSSFDVQITKSASVWELKLAIEDVFQTPQRDARTSISWGHVWGHFSLCYGGQKLTDNTASLQDFGIRDGDQLRFIRKLSSGETPIKRRSMSLDSILETHRMSWARADAIEENEESDGDRLGDYMRSTPLSEEKPYSLAVVEDRPKRESDGDRLGNYMRSTPLSEEKSYSFAAVEDRPRRRGFKLGRLLRRLFSRSKRRKSGRSNSAVSK